MEEREMLITDYLDMCRQYEGLPPFARHLVEKYGPPTKWTLAPSIDLAGFESTDWLEMEGVTTDGKLCMVHFRGEEGLPHATIEGVPASALRPLVSH